ncbi:MAG TPA: response regulator transcription factor [Chloroflexota bacterium]|jgi:DNA-binding NarL/FixJ family response regulator|nr:response regulator transcription factor [Chloroflexota bacterium]
MTDTPLRILLVDDHPFFRHGIRDVLDGEADLRVVAEASGGEAALQQARELRPDGLDLVLLDLDMPDISGITVARRILSEDPELPIVILTASTMDGDLLEALQAGAIGFLSKALTPAAMVRALRAFHYDRVPPLAPSVAARLQAAFRAGPPAREETRAEQPAVNGTTKGTLTDREQEVLELLAGGARDREIAEQLVLSESTVKKHIQHILRKLDARNRMEAVARLRRAFP